MKRYIPYIIMAVLSMASLWSCKRAEIEEPVDQKGWLYVSLGRDDSSELVVKSANVEDYTFSLKIYNSLDQLVTTVPDYSKLTDATLELNVGTYTVVASSAEAAADAAFDAPFYTGSTEVTVQPEAVTNVDITCTLANVKVTTVFSEEIQSKFSIYRLTVSNGSGSSLTFSNEDGTVSKEGYFSATGTLTWSLFLENTDGDQYTSLTETYTDVKARQHYVLSFDLEPAEQIGAGALTITLNSNLSEKEYSMSLDFGDDTVPVVSDSFGSEEGVSSEFNAGDTSVKTVTMTSEDGFRNLYLSYGSELTSSSAVTVDLVNASATLISDLAALGIKAESVTPGAKSATVDITDYLAAQPIGEVGMTIIAVDVNGAYTERAYSFVLRSPVETEAVSADPWAMFATITGKWFAIETPDGIGFMYKKVSDTDWKEVTVVNANTSARTYSAEIRGLEPETEYVFKAVSAKDRETKEITFTTEAAGTLHNMSFDSWYKDGKAWMPNLSSDYQVWDSANPGSASFSIVPTTPTDDVAVSGDGKQAVMMQTKWAVVRLAAGNIYTGKFGSVNLSQGGASLDWGVPFTSRPLALRGYYKYQPASINRTMAPYENMAGQTDICQIQILLTDWDAPFNINTTTATFVDLDNDPNIIAYGKLEDSATTSDYQQFEIKLDYRDMTRTPKYIVITACSSKYGDYFTGGEGSTLYVDEFEFVYDPNDLQ